MTKASILLLADDRGDQSENVLDHIRSFVEGSVHDVHVYNPRGIWHSRILNLEAFDVLVIHYSIIAFVDHQLSPRFREQIRSYRGLKIQFIQDDYRRINRMCELVNYMGIHVFYTLYPTSMIPRVWSGIPDVEVHSTLAGYIPEKLLATPPRPIAERPIDVGYRGRTPPFWLGRLGEEKPRIAREFSKRAPAYGLKYDISCEESDRILGDAWPQFVSSCRVTLGTESGSSIADFDGSIEESVKRYLAKYPHADFEEVHEVLLAEHEENAPIKVISPRIFEAIALRTPLVLFSGEYSGIITPWRHYIPLEKDFSNMDAVVEKIKDTPFLETMAARAYEEIGKCEKYSFRHMVGGFDELVNARVCALVRPSLTRLRLAKIDGIFRKCTIPAWSIPSFHFNIPFTHCAVGRPKIRFGGGTVYRTEITIPVAAATRLVLLVIFQPAVFRLLLELLWYKRRLNLPPVRTLIKEVLLLCAIRQMNQISKSEGGNYCVVVADTSGELFLLSRPSEKAGHIRPLKFPRTLPLIRWDHSRCSDTIQLRLGPYLYRELGVGDDGRYEFIACSLLAEKVPRTVMRAFEYALLCEPEV